MRLINIMGLLLAMTFGGISLTACDSAENVTPLPKQGADTNKQMPKKPATGDQSAAPQENTPSSPVQAQISKKVPLQFGNVDTDKDGSIEPNEAGNIPQIKQQWSQLDKNGDGKLEQAEFARFEQQSSSEKTGRP